MSVVSCQACNTANTPAPSGKMLTTAPRIILAGVAELLPLWHLFPVALPSLPFPGTPMRDLRHEGDVLQMNARS
ncbi:hypothetical protein E2C01_002125 [Portunus trituberculatus]|uniref:Uncharacterized protein n=1 Tax=Portunus trituberculatus TaxID=210409 RepID=A0A5B7CL30_PORTR|nr:hypothetical protein [Portunus trituberculatus]